MISEITLILLLILLCICLAAKIAEIMMTKKADNVGLSYKGEKDMLKKRLSGVFFLVLAAGASTFSGFVSNEAQALYAGQAATLLDVLTLVFMSWQFQTLIGLIGVDLLAGLGKGLKEGFDFQKMAQFYKTNILPYLLGYVALYVGVTFFFQAENMTPEMSGILNQAVVTFAWATLTGALVSSISGNLTAIFGELPQE